MPHARKILPQFAEYTDMMSYQERRDRLVAQYNETTSEVRLAKDTSNLFRDRNKSVQPSLNVRSFSQVLRTDANRGWVEVEGMTPYVDLVAATLLHNRLPCVVPQLKSITIGGAVSGIGIESSSFKYGLVHETILEMEVLTGGGDLILCSPTNEYSDLFFGLPNSYGTLGYILKLKAKVIETKPYVRLEHAEHTNATSYFEHIEKLCTQDIDFLDGTMFQPGEFCITTGTFTEEAPYQSDYTYKNIYYKSIRDKEVDYLTTHDYIWRWDTDWFWCSKNVGAQHPLLRSLFGRKRLNSIQYTKIMRWNSKWGFTRRYNQLRGIHTESVIQDVDIPLQRAAEFYDFFDAEIGIRPVWICPVVVYEKAYEFPLFPMNKQQIYVNFGFWDVVRAKQAKPEGFYNKKVEAMVDKLGGIKSLYSDAYYDQAKFWQIYNQNAYESLKQKYDPGERLKNLYDKCVLRS